MALARKSPCGEAFLLTLPQQTPPLGPHHNACCIALSGHSSLSEVISLFNCHSTEALEGKDPAVLLNTDSQYLAYSKGSMMTY